jgi:hypothetical protein
MFLHQLARDFVLRNKRLKDSLLVNFIYLFYEFIRHYISSGCRYYRIGKLIKLKRSDELVILGTGSTINDLTDAQYKELNNYDVAGLSYSCVLPINQTYYFYESPSFHETALMQEHADKIFPKIIENNKKGLLKFLLWKNSENIIFNKYVNLREFVCPNVCSILTDSLETIKKILRYCSKLKLNRFFLVQKRGSVSALVQFALLLRYKKVIFVGVDLNDSKYFFENNAKFEKYNFTDPYSFDSSYQNKKIHRTNDSSSGIPIIDVLQVMFDEDGTEFYVSSENSALASCLPVWQWQH